MTTKWTLDPSGHEVTFVHKTYWGRSTVRGAFKTVRADGALADDGTGQGAVIVETASLDTGTAQRDNHLRSKAFFDVEHFPTMEFRAERVGPMTPDSSEVRVQGALTVRDVVKPLTFIARADRHGDTVTLSAVIPYDRTEFGMTWNRLGMMAAKGEISLKLRFTRRG